MVYDLSSTSEYRIGRNYELVAQEIIKHKLNVSVIEEQNANSFSEVFYDFKTSDGIAYEIKADLQSFKYKNFFITFEQRFTLNQPFVPAGISKTKADYHLLLFGDSFYKIKTTIIIQHILTNNYKIGVYNNNRGNTIHGYKIPVSDLEKYSIIYKIHSI